MTGAGICPAAIAVCNRAGTVAPAFVPAVSAAGAPDPSALEALAAFAPDAFPLGPFAPDELAATARTVSVLNHIGNAILTRPTPMTAHATRTSRTFNAPARAVPLRSLNTL